MDRVVGYATIVLSLSVTVTATTIGSASYTSFCQNVEKSCTKFPKSCLELRCQGLTNSGIYTIYPTGHSQYSFKVYCDQKTDGGGWTVFQRRMDGSVDFYRNWQNYKLGFGNVTAEHWLGNDKLAQLLSLHPNNELRVELESEMSEKAYAKYSKFQMTDESTHYTLTVGGYSGTAGDGLKAHSGSKFSTYDYDRDSWPNNCAVIFHGAWWYKACHSANLNGKYLQGTHGTFANGVNWNSFKGNHDSLKTAEMKFRSQV